MGIEDSMRRAGDEVAGRAKEMWGDLTDDERLEAEGRAQHTADDAHRGHRADDTLVERHEDYVSEDLRPTTGDDGTLREALRDDMGQPPHRGVADDDSLGTPGDDGTLRDALRDDMGQDLHGHDTTRRDSI